MAYQTMGGSRVQVGRTGQLAPGAPEDALHAATMKRMAAKKRLAKGGALHRLTSGLPNPIAELAATGAD